MAFISTAVWPRRWSWLAIAAGLAVAGAAHAEPGLRLADVATSDTETIGAGEQLLLTHRSGSFRFAGRELVLRDFSGVVGYASEAAYVVVIDGEARDHERRIGPGRMLILPPYGGRPDVQLYDAARFLAGWGPTARTAAPEATTQLTRLAAGQRTGIFFGRLGPTRFNVMTGAAPRHEASRRALLGSPTVRSIRFAGLSSADAVERRVAEAFRSALLAGDADAVAVLLDPMPYGGRSLAGGAAEARVLAARALLTSRNWPRLIGSAPPTPEGDHWRLGGARLTLTAVDDFVFVQQVAGDSQ